MRAGFDSMSCRVKLDCYLPAQSRRAAERFGCGRSFKKPLLG